LGMWGLRRSGDQRVGGRAGAVQTACPVLTRSFGDLLAAKV